MDSSQDKTLPASERKLQKSRDDGQGVRSRDLSHLAILGMGAVGVMLFMPMLMEYMQRAMSRQLSFNAAIVMAPGNMLVRLNDMIAIGVIASIGFAAFTGIAAVVSAIAAGGWIFSLKPISPQFNRLDPLAGTANLFSKQQMVNVVKMVLLSAVLAFVAWKYMGSSLHKVAMLVLQPSPLAMGYVADWLTAGMALLLLVIFLVAAVDVPLQSYLFKDRLKMSHEEVKQEHKESDGNPHTKSRQRQRQRELADRASVGSVPKADFVVMNPTHYAVALKYDEATMSAPQVISRGTDLVALHIRDLAKAHAVPVLESPVLARALYAHAELEQAIPAALYTAVAQVLAYVYRLKAAMRGEGRMPDSLTEPFVPPELDPHNKLAQRTHAV